LNHALDAALSSSCGSVAVVLGAHAARIEPTLGVRPVVRLLNADWREGVASSIRRAANWAAHERFSALLLALADQPELEAPHLDGLLAAHARGGGLVASRYAGLPAVPALFPASYFSALTALRGDAGARGLLRAVPALELVDWPEGERDIDEPADAAPCFGSANRVGIECNK
jgi:molybdenum cofactor cytidylyltransferase